MTDKSTPFAKKRAFVKFAAYLNSCTTSTHLTLANKLLSIYKQRYPDEMVGATRLWNILQLKRIDIQYLSIYNKTS